MNYNCIDEQRHEENRKLYLRLHECEWKDDFMGASKIYKMLGNIEMSKKMLENQAGLCKSQKDFMGGGSIYEGLEMWGDAFNMYFDGANYEASRIFGRDKDVYDKYVELTKKMMEKLNEWN